MELKDIETIIRADKYTADGREAILKATEAETEDRVYQNGEISQKTGLMKTPNGWVEPPTGVEAAARKRGDTRFSGEGKNQTESKWTKTKDYLDRERISMKTPQGGMVSIYETDNPGQKNNRFRVDTGSHADYFNTMEEAKAFAEKHYGQEDSAPRVLTSDTKIRVRKA